MKRFLTASAVALVPLGAMTALTFASPAKDVQPTPIARSTFAPFNVRSDSHGPVDFRAHASRPMDVFVLGCLLFECLAGRAPFPGPTEAAVIYGHLEEPPPRVTEMRPSLPRAFDAVLVRALHKDPERRWADGAELAQAARAALDTNAERRRTGRRLALTPQRIHQPVGRDDLPGVQEQQGQQLPLPRTSDGHLGAVVQDLERPSKRNSTPSPRGYRPDTHAADPMASARISQPGQHPRPTVGDGYRVTMRGTNRLVL